MRVCLPHLRQVTTTWGSLLDWMRTRQFTPGGIKLLQCLQMSCLYSLGSRRFVFMAIFLAISVYRCASSGFSWTFSLARRKRVWMRCRAICFVMSVSSLFSFLKLSLSFCGDKCSDTSYKPNYFLRAHFYCRMKKAETMRAVPMMVLCKILPLERNSCNWPVLIKPMLRSAPRSSRGSTTPTLNMAMLAMDWSGWSKGREKSSSKVQHSLNPKLFKYSNPNLTDRWLKW